MKHPKAGDVVVYRAFGREVNALVLAARTGEPSHLGSSGEPLLTLALIDPYRETGLPKDKNGQPYYPFGRIPEVKIEHDVVHTSHMFSEEFFKAKKLSSPSAADIAALRGHGEWREYEGDQARASTISSLRSQLSIAQANLKLTTEDAARHKANADLATSVGDSLKKELEALKAKPAESAD